MRMARCASKTLAYRLTAANSQARYLTKCGSLISLASEPSDPCFNVWMARLRALTASPRLRIRRSSFLKVSLTKEFAKNAIPSKRPNCTPA